MRLLMVVLIGVTLVSGGLVAACTPVDGTASSAEPTEMELPPRPRDVRINGIEPCSLLTEQQRAGLRLDGNPSSRSAPSALFGGDESVCVIRGFAPRAVSVGVGLVTTAGIELVASGELEATITPLLVQGFPAVLAAHTRLKDFCSVFVDLAPGQMLDIQFADGGREPPVPQEQLCRNAQVVADAAMTTLLAR